MLCFRCGGGLKGWQPDEDPWEEHAKHYPGYILTYMYIDYIDESVWWHFSFCSVLIQLHFFNQMQLPIGGKGTGVCQQHPAARPTKKWSCKFSELLPLCAFYAFVIKYPGCCCGC